MFKRLLTVSGFTALSRLTGFLSSMVMAYVLGAGMASDAFMAAFRLPNTFRSIFGEGAFNNAFLPRYAAINTREGAVEAARFADEIYSWQIAAQLFLLVVAMVAMRWIIAILAPGFSAHPGQAELAAELSRITFPYLIMTVSSVQLSAMLNAVGKFAAAAAWSILLNLTMMACLFGASWFPSAAHAAACGVFIGGVVQLAFIATAAARQTLRLHIRLPRWTPRVKEFLLALGSATVGSASVQISVFIDTVIASFLPIGGLTALYYADRINQLPTGTLAIALGTVLLPEMANLLAKGDRAGADAAQNRSAALGLLLTLPFVAVFFLIPDVIMRALFAHGHFDAAAAQLSAMALAGYGVGLPAFVLIRSVSATFYARGDTNSPMRATLLAFAVNIALKFVFVWGFGLGVAGIALGTAIGAWINVTSLVVMARRQSLITIGPVFTRSLIPSVLAAVVAGAGAWAGALLGHYVAAAGLWHDLSALFGAIVLSVAGYLVVVAVFRHRLPLPRRR
ncbi:MAG: murein biosynthesis integral membrane protein MurJ [Rhizomicrobium sp.]